ncbi:MAG: hypothetical protein ACO378_07710, partial [Sedimenticolaceae bacterium]
MKKLPLLFLILSAQLFAVEAYDPYAPIENGYDPSLEVPWVEIETQVNQLPQEENLKQLRVDKLDAMPSGMRFSMDLE